MTLDINDFVVLNRERMQFTEDQASAFAKGVAGDFNPIHDVGGKRFCVPGDLLFSVLLKRYGVYSNMRVDFASMVSANKVIPLPAKLTQLQEFHDADSRHLLTLSTEGEYTTEPAFIENITREYVQFSGKTFPDILVGLMRHNHAMINPARPLVIYKDMSISLKSLRAREVTLVSTDAQMAVDGKKGTVRLSFEFHADGQLLGSGEKHMVLSGLREYDEAAMQEIVAQYNDWKAQYKSA